MASTIEDIEEDFTTIEDFSTSELIRELAWRLSSERHDTVRIIKDFPLLSRATNIRVLETLEIASLEDEMKLEHFAKVFNKYTSAQIEAMLPE